MKKYISLFIVAVMLITQLGITASAAEINVSAQKQEMEQASVQPRLNYDGSAHLTTAWTNILTDDNWLNEILTVKSSANNAGKVELRVLNHDDQIVGSVKSVEPGKSVKLDKISHASGTYTLQGRTTTEEDNGYYSFVVQD